MKPILSRIILLLNNKATTNYIRRLLLQGEFSITPVLTASKFSDFQEKDIHAGTVIITDKNDLINSLQQRYHTLPPVILLQEKDEISTSLCPGNADDCLLLHELNTRALSKSILYVTAIKENAFQYAKFFQESPAPMYIFDNTNFRFHDVNEAALKQYGYSREEFMSLSANDIRGAECLEMFYGNNKNAPENFYDAGIWKHQRKNNELFFAHVFCFERIINGKKATVVIANDINEKINTRSALKEKEEEINNILESITDGCCFVNSNWEFVYVNNIFEKILNCSREYIMGRNIWDAFPEAKSMSFLKKHKAAMHKKTVTNFEEFYTPLNVWIKGNVYPMKHGIAIFFEDITNHKKIQEKLLQDEHNMRAIINNTSDIIWSVDREGKTIIANDAYLQRVERITGKPARTLTDQDFDPQLFNAWNDYYKRALEGHAFTFTWIEKNGRKNTFEEVSLNPVKNKDGNVYAVACFSRNVTDQRQHTQWIEEQNKRLKDIAWIHSHKIRSHVANILGLIQLFDFNNCTNPENTQLLSLVGQCATNMDKVIREISSLAWVKTEKHI